MLFPNSPGNYHHHNPTSEYDQETITIINPTKIPPKKTKLFTASHSSLPGWNLWGPGLFILKKTKFFSGLKVPVPIVTPITTNNLYFKNKGQNTKMFSKYRLKSSGRITQAGDFEDQ